MQGLPFIALDLFQPLLVPVLTQTGPTDVVLCSHAATSDSSKPHTVIWPKPVQSASLWWTVCQSETDVLVWQRFIPAMRLRCWPCATWIWTLAHTNREMGKSPSVASQSNRVHCRQLLPLCAQLAWQSGKDTQPTRKHYRGDLRWMIVGLKAQTQKHLPAGHQTASPQEMVQLAG